MRSGVGRWRLQCYTIKSHCAGLFLALRRDHVYFMSNFLRKLICLKLVMLQTDSLDYLLCSCLWNSQWMYERHPQVPRCTRRMENFMSWRCCTCRIASAHSQYRQMRAKYCGPSGKWNEFCCSYSWGNKSKLAHWFLSLFSLERWLMWNSKRAIATGPWSPATLSTSPLTVIDSLVRLLK